MTKKKHIYQNQSGFVELEYLMAAAIGLIVIAAFATGLSQMSNMQRKNDIAQDSAMLVEDLANSLKAGDFCTTKLNTLTLDPDTSVIANISIPYDIGTGIVDIRAGNEIQPGLRVTKVQVIQNPLLTPTKVITAAATLWQHAVVLRIGTEKLVNGQALAMKDHDIPMLLSVDGADHKVKYCNTDSLAAQTCYQSGGTYRDTVNTAAGETHCMPTNHCDFGGSFSRDPNGGGFGNPLLNGAQGCPAGFSEQRTGTVSKIATAAKYTAVSNSYYGIISCMRCGPTLSAQSGGVSEVSWMDSASLAAAVDSVNTIGSYQTGLGTHVTQTGQTVGVSPIPPPPLPTPPPPPPPTPIPTATPPPPPQCDGTVQYSPNSAVSGANDCTAGTVFTEYPWSDGMGNGGVIYLCSCPNYNTATPTPTPTPGATPTDCQGWENLYVSQYNYQCGGTLSCIGNGSAVRETCDTNSWYTSSAGGAPVEHNTCGCFAAGSRVTLANGSTKAIEKMTVGDQVLSYDESTDSQIVTTVMKPIKHQPREQVMHDFTLANGRVIRATDAHPIYVVERRQYVLTREVAALSTLGIKLSLLDQSGTPVAIRSVRTYSKKIGTYNLSVDGIIDGVGERGGGLGHNYYLEGALVHNNSLCNP